MCVGVCGGQKRALDSLEQELDSCEPPRVCWELNLGLLKVERMLSHFFKPQFPVPVLGSSAPPPPPPRESCSGVRGFWPLGNVHSGAYPHRDTCTYFIVCVPARARECMWGSGDNCVSVFSFLLSTPPALAPASPSAFCCTEGAYSEFSLLKSDRLYSTVVHSQSVAQWEGLVQVIHLGVSAIMG